MTKNDFNWNTFHCIGALREITSGKWTLRRFLPSSLLGDGKLGRFMLLESSSLFRHDHSHDHDNDHDHHDLDHHPDQAHDHYVDHDHENDIIVERQ